MKTSILSKRYLPKFRALTLAALALGPALTTRAADTFWTGPAASYTNAANWSGGIVPGAGDNAINTNGVGNVVQINAGNPDWTVTDISAGGVTDGAGAFQQNGQTVSVNGWMLLGSGNNATGIYTLNSGTLNVLGGRIFLGSNPNSTSALNINSGTVNKTGDTFVVADGGWNGTSSRTGTVNQVSGMVNCSSELWLGQFGDGVGTGYGIYNLSGGTLNVSNWLALGRSGGNGKMTMTGGVINKYGNGNFLVGTGFQTPGGGSGVAELTQSGGTINSSGEFSVPENSPSSGTYNLSGTGVLNVDNWMQIGRSGGTGLMNMSGGSVTKTGSGNFIVGDNATGVMNQTAGSISVNNEGWVGQGGSGNGTYNLSGGSISVGNWIAIGRAGGTGVLNLTNGLINKVNNGNFAIGSGGGNGTINQYGGVVSNQANASSITYLGEAGGSGTWYIHGGTVAVGTLQFCQGGNGSGTLYLNGGLVTAQEVNCGITGANGTFYFNGGTLRANADNANFFHGLGGAFIDAGGAVIDSQGFNVTMTQTLTDFGGGSVTKLGSGRLALTGFNGYAGATIVSAGTLAVTTDSSAGSTGGYTVASGAKLAVKVQADEAQLNTASATFNGSASTMEVDLGNFGNPTAAPVNLSGNLAVNGTVTINLLDTLPQFGQFPVIKYGTKSGAGSFVIGSLPVGVLASVVNNTANNSIDINITTVNAPRWEGQAGGNWDVGVTTNWVNIGDGLPTFFAQGNPVVFNDLAAGTTTANLVTTVNPTSVTFDNSALSYTLNGSGKISGSTGLTKQGDNVTTIANTGGNDYTGATVISGGALSVASLANGGSPSAIGASSASPTNLVLAGGMLSYSGPAVAINRGYSLQGAGGIIETVGNLTLSGPVVAAPGSGFMKSGPGQLAYKTVGSNFLTGAGAEGYLVTDGSVVFDGSAGGQTNTVQGSLAIAGATANATIVMTNTTVTSSGNMDVGIVASSTGTLNVNTNTALTVGSWFTMGDAANSTSTVNLNGGTINVNNGRLFLCSAPGTIATLNINGGTINKNGDYFAVVNGGWNGVGARTGVVNQVSGTVGGGSEMWVGDGGGAGGNDSLGIYNLSGGTLTVNNWMGIGRDGSQGIFSLTGGTLNKGGGGDMVIGRGTDNTIGTFNMSGGTLNKSGGNPLIIGQNSGHGLFNQSGGTLTVDSEYWVGVDGNTTDATNNISGTAVFNINNWLSLGRGGRAVVNFSGGRINKSGSGAFIVGDNGTSVFTQTGGTNDTFAELWIAQAGGGVGEYNLSIGVVTAHNWLAVGREGGKGTLNISGGTFIKDGNGNISICHGGGATGTVNQTGGAFSCTAGEAWIGEDNGPGIWNISGGTASFGLVLLARDGSATGTLNLNGGTVSATEITTSSAGTSTANLNGGTLGALANNVNFLHGLTAANVLAGGVTVNSGTNTVSISQALLDGSGGGGLNKTGNGTLYLNGVNTYTGTTLVSQGTLGGTGTIAGPVSVTAGASLAPGTSIGTLTINNTLNLAGTSTTVMELSKNANTNDVVTGVSTLTYGGTLVLKNLGGVLAVNDTFKVFNAAAYAGSFSSVVSQTPGQTVTWDTSNLAVNGTVKVLTAVTTPVILTPVFGGNTISLTWPTLGYRLEAQTNSLATGLNTNWATVPGSTEVTSMVMPVVPGNPTVFFRLVFP